MKITIIPLDALAARTTLTLDSTKAAKPLVTDYEFQVLLNWLWRQFNRNDGSELISLANVPMPSLSVGDAVKVEQTEHPPRAWRCASTGWEVISL